ncbi:MAG: hypothetical protein WCK29_03330 [archaeon]
MNVSKINGWSELVSNLKRFKSFGFHGAENKNLQSILNEVPHYGGVFGHYFGANKDMKKEPNELFYQRLYSSIGVAQGFSRAYQIEKGNMAVFSSVALIFGINDEYPDRFLGHTADGTYGKTLAIGHDMSEEFKFYPLILPKIKLEEINVAADFMRDKSKNDACPYVATSYFINRKIIEGLLREMKKATREHIKSNRQ